MNICVQKLTESSFPKTRYLIPEKDGLTIELDVFDAPYEGLYLAEVEFSSEEQALSYNPPVWFGEDVTNSGKYHNSPSESGKFIIKTAPKYCSVNMYLQEL